MESNHRKSMWNKVKRFLPKKFVPQTGRKVLRRIIVVVLFVGMLKWGLTIWGIIDKTLAEILADMVWLALIMVFFMRDSIFQNGD